MRYVDLTFLLKTSWIVVATKPKILQGYVKSSMKQSRILYIQSIHFGKPYGNPTTNKKIWQVFESNLILMLDWGWFTVCLVKLNLVIRSHIVTIITLDCVLVHFVIFLFYNSRSRAVAESWCFRGFQPKKTFQTQ